MDINHLRVLGWSSTQSPSIPQGEPLRWLSRRSAPLFVATPWNSAVGSTLDLHGHMQQDLWGDPGLICVCVCDTTGRDVRFDIGPHGFISVEPVVCWNVMCGTRIQKTPQKKSAFSYLSFQQTQRCFPRLTRKVLEECSLWFSKYCRWQTFAATDLLPKFITAEMLPRREEVLPMVSSSCRIMSSLLRDVIDRSQSLRFSAG